MAEVREQNIRSELVWQYENVFGKYAACREMPHALREEVKQVESTCSCFSRKVDSSLFRQIDEGKRIKFLNTLVFMKSPKVLSATPPPLGPYAPSPRLRTSK